MDSAARRRRTFTITVSASCCLTDAIICNHNQLWNQPINQRRTRMKHTFMIAALSLASLLSGSCASSTNTQASGDPKPAATDQASTPRQRYSLIETQAKPGMSSAFIEFTKKETIPALQKAGIKQLGFYTTAVFGE